MTPTRVPDLPRPHPQRVRAVPRGAGRLRPERRGCPTCPDWDAADLLWHLAGVQLFWAKVIRHRPASPTTPRSARSPPRSGPRRTPSCSTPSTSTPHALVDRARARPTRRPRPGHWSRRQTVGTSYRRQAHEALIHRLDAELAAGVRVTPLDAALAADGVAEVLDVMYGGAPAWGSFTRSGETIARAT